MKLPTRRNASFLLSALILALLAVLLFLTNACLLPARTIRATEIPYSTGETQVIRRETAGPFTYHLSGNDHALLLSSCQFSLPALSWYDMGDCVLDLTQEPGPVWAGSLVHRWQEDQWSSLHLFGRVDLTDAVAVRAAVSGFPDVETDLFSGPDGRTYFWVWLEGDETAFMGSEPVCTNLAVLDGKGVILCTYDPSQHHMSWSG